MTSSHKFYLDEVLLTTEPRGWDDIEFFVKLDKDLNGRLTFIDVSLEFFGDGYDMITDKLYSDGFCSTMTLRIMEKCSSHDYKTIHEGLILLSKVSINEQICSVTIKPDDNSFYSKIDKNRSLKAFPWVESSKNNAVITPAPLYQVGFFAPSTGVYYPVITTTGMEYSGGCYRVYDLFKYLLAYMSDGTVEFESTLFGTGGDDEWFMLTTGTVLFTVQTGLGETGFKDNFPDISFEDLFKEVSKKRHIGFYFDTSGLKPRMNIELVQNIPSGNLLATLDNIDKITTEIDTARLFNVLKIGSNTTQDVAFPALQFPEGIDWVGFKSEQYNILGNCGVDTELDLVSNYIISSNVIEDAIVSPSNAYEGQFAFIECHDQGAPFILANQTNPLNPPAPPYYYNQGLINSEVAKRYLGAVPASIAKFLGNNDNTFLAERTTDGNTVNVPSALGGLATVFPLIFQDDFNSPNTDPSNNWNPAVPPTTGAATFTCPQTGFYHFTVSLNVHLSANDRRSQIGFRRYDSGGTLIIEQFSAWEFLGTFTPSDTVVTGSTLIYLEAGDTLQTAYYQKSIGVAASFKILKGSTMACDNDVTGAGVYQTYDPRDYLGLIHKFEYPLNESQWQAIKNDTRGEIAFAQKGQALRSARIDTIRFNKTGISQVKLIRSINT